MSDRPANSDELKQQFDQLSELVGQMRERDEQREREMAEIKAQLAVATQSQCKAELRVRQAHLNEAGRLFAEGAAAYGCANYLKALECWEASRNLVKTFTVCNNLGVVYKNLGRIDDALAAYAEAERLRQPQGLPPGPDVSFGRALVSLAQGNTTDACRLAREAKRMNKQQELRVPQKVEAFLAQYCADDPMLRERGRNREVGPD